MNAKFFFFPVVAASAVLAFVLAPPSSKGEVGADDSAFAALLNDVAAQQATIVENQTNIDAKVAVVAESVRQARLFVSRGR